MAQCTAKSKRTGQQCQQNAMRGSTKCYSHGGATPKGIASPHFKTGRYSKVLPTRLLEDFAASINDPALLDLTREIGVIDARLHDILKRVDSGESGQTWKELKATYKAMQIAHAKGDNEATADALNELGRLITKGHMDTIVWGEVGQLIEHRRRLVESEQKRLVALQQMIRADKFMVFVQVLADSVKRNVSNKHEVAAIQNDIAKLLSME